MNKTGFEAVVIFKEKVSFFYKVFWSDHCNGETGRKLELEPF